MNIHEKVADYLKMEVNDTKRALKMWKEGSLTWGDKDTPAFLMKCAYDRGLGVVMFAQSFDGANFNTLDKMYEDFKAEIKKEVDKVKKT